MREERKQSRERDAKRDSSRDHRDVRDNRDNSDSRDNRDARNDFGWSKKRVPTSRSGRVIKGRGVFVCIAFFSNILKCSI